MYVRMCVCKYDACTCKCTVVVHNVDSSPAILNVNRSKTALEFNKETFSVVFIHKVVVNKYVGTNRSDRLSCLNWRSEVQVVDTRVIIRGS